MKILPKGEYKMGDLAGDGRDNENPARNIKITDKFAISIHPVTVSEFREFVQATGYETVAERAIDKGCWGVKADLTIGWLPTESWANNRLKQTETHPVVCVSWSDAQVYVAWLSEVTGFTYRLPTEVEWEYAGRAGSDSKYFFGDDPAKVCEFINHADLRMIEAWGADTGASTCDDGYLTTSPSGSYPANNFGLHDFYGNVWEWVQDCDKSDQVNMQPSSDLILNSENLASCSARLLRGASWASLPIGVTASYRISAPEDLPTVDYGFRIVREI